MFRFAQLEQALAARNDVQPYCFEGLGLGRQRTCTTDLSSLIGRRSLRVEGSAVVAAINMRCRYQASSQLIVRMLDLYVA